MHKENKTPLKTRIELLIKKLSEGLHERKEHAAVALLAVLAGQNIFLLGPPGTAKSMLARRLKSAFADSNYFEYLMQRFSTPDEIFGPVSIAALKKDEYIRKTEGFLPEADFAFLDEIWKSNPAILNTLLTIINEKTYRNGTEIKPAPLKALIAASNETPPEKQGLEALYDRFIVRLHVSPMEERDNFESLLQNKPAAPEIKCGDAVVTAKELKKWRKEMGGVKLSPETLHIIQAIRLALSEKQNELGVYVSDRRWQKAAALLKAAAYFCGRTETNLVDALLLRHCLWTTAENREAAVKIVENEVRQCGFITGLKDGKELADEKTDLEKEIKKELYFSEDVYEIVLLDGTEYLKSSIKYQRNTEPTEFYIPYGKIKTANNFHPVDQNLREIEDLVCNFNSGTDYSVSSCSHYFSSGRDSHTQSPKIKARQDCRKPDISNRVLESFKRDMEKITARFDESAKMLETRKAGFRKIINTPFVAENICNIALESVDLQLQKMKKQKLDCDRLIKEELGG